MKFLSYLTTPISLLVFGFHLVFFHAVQLVCALFSERCRQKSIVWLCYGLTYCPWWVGARIRFVGFSQVQSEQPIIVLSNHQSALDIPAVVLGFRQKYMRFVAKQSLGKGIPSVSHNLKVGGSALINRSNPRQAISEIARLGKLTEQECSAVSIFPEGTRSKDGTMRPFQSSGVTTLLRYIPSAVVVPVAIEGHYEFGKNGFYPLPWGTRMTYTALSPIDPRGKSGEEVSQEAERAIRAVLERK